MKPYAFKGDGSDITGCCPSHDWPSTHRWSGMNFSKRSAKKHRKFMKMANRARRRKDRFNLRKDEEDVS